MRRIILVLAAVAACAVVVGCTAGVSGDYVVLKDPPAIQSNDNTATVVFMRKSNMAGGMVGYYIWENNHKVCILESGTYCVHQASPGEHVFYAETFGGWTPTTKRSEFKVSVDAGKTYYIESSIAFQNRPSFDLTAEGEAMQIIEKLKNVQLK